MKETVVIADEIFDEGAYGLRECPVGPGSTLSGSQSACVQPPGSRAHGSAAWRPFGNCGHASHAAVASLPTQPPQEPPFQQLGAEPVGFRPAMLPRYRETGGMDHVRLEPALGRQGQSGQPEGAGDRGIRREAGLRLQRNRWSPDQRQNCRRRWLNVARPKASIARCATLVTQYRPH